MKILAFGEILWDLFPGRKCIGGAPFNFAAHAAGLGAQAALISAVGCDALGEEARRQLRAHGVSDTWVAYSSLPTGSCAVTLGPDGTPRYTLHTGVAYDAIPVPAAALEDADLFYFGTLAQRDARSRSALWRILRKTASGRSCAILTSGRTSIRRKSWCKACAPVLRSNSAGKMRRFSRPFTGLRMKKGYAVNSLQIMKSAPSC